jgi:hypothetical protein
MEIIFASAVYGRGFFLLACYPEEKKMDLFHKKNELRQINDM